MDILDVYSFHNKIITAGVATLTIGYSTVENQTPAIVSDSLITFHWQNVKSWFDIFCTFIFEDSFTSITVVDEHSGLEYHCFIHDNSLRVEKKMAKAEKKVFIDFSMADASETLYGISRVFVSALALPPSHAYGFSELVNHFASFPAADLSKTENLFKTIQNYELMDLYCTITENMNVPTHPFTLYTCLEKYRPFVLTLVKMRLVKTLMALKNK